ncbi:hypothetical protein A6X21_06260 [Planctopirus hydrillae]|uniref:Uncharacterized protein n=1 Tax=Planctopirus hydrillae TaxID=1841610 RepID=A0A1C3E9M2_9PLAN|nr:hypothetical protein A6X21_06260 [Planctopirus hydrillae]
MEQAGHQFPEGLIYSRATPEQLEFPKLLVSHSFSSANGSFQMISRQRLRIFCQARERLFCLKRSLTIQAAPRVFST